MACDLPHAGPKAEQAVIESSEDVEVPLENGMKHLINAALTGEPI
jgi:hypothetical protein